MDQIQNLAKDSNDKPFETVRITGAEGIKVQPFATALAAVPMPSSNQGYGYNQASFQSSYSPEEQPQDLPKSADYQTDYQQDGNNYDGNTYSNNYQAY